MQVPKIIWQTHNYEFDELPIHLKQTAQTWKNLNPGWDYRYLNHHERLESIKSYDILSQSYLIQEPVTQSDIWRYIVTYEHGGVYADMDSVCVKPLDYLLQGVKDCDILVVPSSHNGGWGTNNANYAVKPKSEIMKNIIKAGEQYAIDAYKKAVPIYEKHTFDWFIDEVEKSNKVSYEFTSAWHTQEFKTGFTADFLIDNCGQDIKYTDFVDKYNLSYF
jgi:mannosyltransferase OCH1-like enzyme